MNGAVGKKYDLVILGATGFTGKLVAKYLLTTYGASPARFQWALAGRSQEKLDGVKDELANIVSPDANTLPTLTADTSDAESMKRLAAACRVVITTVGPYGIYGEKLIEACAKAGTHYCDLTGETFFVEEMIEKYHALAKESGAKIVPSCGFDSIPADLGTFMMAEHLRRVHGRQAEQITYMLAEAKGSFSGGTVASALDIVRQLWEGGRPAMARMADPYLLADPESFKFKDNFKLSARQNDPGGFGYDREAGTWTAPLVFAGHDSKLVHRTNSLLGGAYGSTFRYKEVMACKGFFLLGFVKALLTTVATAVGGALLFFPPTRAVLAKYVLPKPGQGPTKEQMDNGCFWVDYIAKAAPAPAASSAPQSTATAPASAEPLIIKGRVGSDKGDMGYKETAKMLSECGLCLALDRAGDGEGGVLTTASAMGLDLVRRLRDAGMTFEVIDPAAPPSSSGGGSFVPTGLGATLRDPQTMAANLK